ncbi:MAG: hypothetical protein KDC33_07335 [Thermoleophilia bacterium]|nr:hypothetical protein [Thermoleophilia bacterium]
MHDVSEVAPEGADRQEPPAPADGPRQRLGRVLAVILIAAAGTAAAVLAATSGLRNDEIVDRASALGALGAETTVARGHPPVFRGLRFPDLSPEGWQPVAGRRDVVGDRVALTVFYTGSGDGRRLAVTILFGQALPPPPGSEVVRSGGVSIARKVNGDRAVVSWRRRGRTTIMSMASAEHTDLVRLARLATPQSRSVR